MAVGIAIAITLVTAIILYSGSREAEQVIIDNGRTQWAYDLKQNVEVDVVGPLGTTVIVIADGKVEFRSSPCVNQTCVASGPIASVGAWNACLPNGVIVRIEGKNTDKDSVDYVAW
jgi:hypothetical protein